MDTGYGVEIRTVDDFASRKIADASYIFGPLSPVVVLKLHGSINWGIPELTPDNFDEVFRPLENAEAIPISESDFQPRADLSFFSLKFRPFIIPPILDKSVLLRSRVLRLIWNMALESLAQAEQLTFIGYSLPATDFQTEFLFRQAIKGRSVKIMVVAGRDTSKLVPSFENVFGNLVDGRDRTFLEYAERSFGKG